jgi:hypothetical protein
MLNLNVMMMMQEKNSGEMILEKQDIDVCE